MKKLAITIAAVFATLNIFAQGTVNFSNLTLGTTSYVYVDTGAAPVRAPIGTTYTVALYFAPVDPLNPNVQPASSAFAAVGLTSHITPSAGSYAAPTVLIPSATPGPGISPPGSMGWFQVKAWATAYGNTFEECQTAFLAGNMQAIFGVSRVIEIPVTGNPTIVPQTLPANLKDSSGNPIGRVDIGVPEPALLGLGLLGGAAMLLLRRRK